MIYQTNAQIKVLNEIGFSTEKEMQKFCETNLDMLLGLTFVTTEFKVAQFRFDSVAYNPATKAFIIIEYKNTSNFSVIDQGYKMCIRDRNTTYGSLDARCTNKKGELRPFGF